MSEGSDPPAVALRVMHTQTNGSCTSNNGADRGGGEVDPGTVALLPWKTMDGAQMPGSREQLLYSQACRDRGISCDSGQSVTYHDVSRGCV